MSAAGGLGGGMFGHSKNDQNQDDQNTNLPEPHLVEPVANGSLAAGNDATTHLASEPSGPPPTMATPSVDDNPALPPAGFVPFTPSAQANQTPVPSVDTNADVGLPAGHQDEAPQPANDLLEIKKAALQKLNPLVSQLDQSPEEKFKTTMMMIQATDDKSLINQAYEAAQNIPDEKARAQALLDVVNEINYFTQHQS